MARPGKCIAATALIMSSMASAAPLVGLALTSNGPSAYKLVSVNQTSGELEFLGGGEQEEHAELAGTGDLCAVDTNLGVWYYLGDSSAGTTLVGLSTADGSLLCESAVTSLMEIGIVGAGQSLDFDSTGAGSLVLSGVSTNVTTQHVVLRLALGEGAKRELEAKAKKSDHTGKGSSEVTGCGVGGGAEFEALGTFGDDAYLPFVHASAIDPAGQRLFVTLQPGDDEVSTNSLAVAVVDISDGSTGEAYYTIPMDYSVDSSHILYGIDWDSALNRLVGAVINEQGTGLMLRSVEVGANASASVAWSELPIAGTPSSWKYLGGNSATVSSLDEAGRILYFEAGNNRGMSLAAVHVDTAELLADPLFTGDVPLSTSGLTMMSVLA